MPEWRVVVADDEPAARRGVRLLLSAYPDFVVVADCRNGREVLDALDRLAPDVIFLDIQMPEIGGLDVIRLRSAERMPAVVFLTAYDRYALSAFDVEAVDYLVKPVAPARFARAVRRLTARLSTRGAAPSEPSLTVSTPRGAVVLPLHAIEWIESADHYARVWSAGRAWLLREPLDQLEARVSPYGFMRVHRRAIVRVGAVRALLTGEGDGEVAELASGTRVPVARRRKAALAAAVRAGWPGAGRG